MAELQLSAADLIKRFREAKPASAEERRSALGIGAGRAKMWWEDADTPTTPAALSIERARERERLRDTAEESPLPRGRNLLVSPERQRRETPPSTLVSTSTSVSALQARERERERVRASNALGERDRYRERSPSISVSRDFGQSLSFPRQSTERERGELGRGRESERDSGFRERTFGRSLDVDAMLQHQLHQLTEEARRKEQDTLRRLRSTPFDLSLSSSLRRPTGSERDRERHKETLGSSGFLSLLKQELKLDGIKTKPPPAEEAAAAFEGPTTEELNAQLERILEDIKKSAEAIAPEEPAEPPKTGFLPEGVEETIPQIAAQLEREMELHLTPLQRRHAVEEESAAAQAAKEQESVERAREEGREEERRKRLLEAIDVPGITHPREMLSLWRAPSVFEREKERDRGRDALGDSTEEEELQRLRREHSRDDHRERGRGRDAVPEAARVMQRLVDSELSSAEHIFLQMRGLRGQLGRELSRAHAFADGSASGLPGDDGELDHGENKGRNAFNPFPELVHRNILSVTQAVESSLNVAMDLLQKRLPEPVSVPEEPAAPPALLSLTIGSALAEEHKEEEKEAEEARSSLDFDLSVSMSASPERGNISESAAAAAIDVKAHFDAIDSILGPEDAVVYKPLAAHRFDRFLSSSSAPRTVPWSEETKDTKSPVVLDPLRDVRRERAVHFGSPEERQQQRKRDTTAHAPVPSAPQSLPVYSPLPAPANPSFSAPRPTHISASLSAPAAAPTSSSAQVLYNPYGAVPFVPPRPPQLSVPAAMRSTPARAVEGSAMAYIKTQQRQSSSPSSVTAVLSPSVTPSVSVSPFFSPPVSASSSMTEREAYLHRMRTMRMAMSAQL